LLAAIPASARHSQFPERLLDWQARVDACLAKSPGVYRTAPTHFFHSCIKHHVYRKWTTALVVHTRAMISTALRINKMLQESRQSTLAYSISVVRRHEPLIFDELAHSLPHFRSQVIILRMNFRKVLFFRPGAIAVTKSSKDVFGIRTSPFYTPSASDR
jgi:hypothetical protein